jgi:8-oxo-dGTP pyrophosphatase MutT (NUDIX family)
MSTMSQSTLPPIRDRRVVVPGFDPQTQPIVATKALVPLSPATLELDFICAAFNSPVDWHVEPVFSASFSSNFLDCNDIVRAAVFVPLVQRPSGLSVIFTRRSPQLYDHAGQISFPGGRIEPSDRDAIAAALRETQEEIGVAPQFVQLIGTQPGFLTSTRFTMQPVIGLVRPGFTITPAPDEVAEVFEVPLSVLMDPARHRLHQAQLAGGGHRFYFSITWHSYFIWGATAALIRNFYHFLAAAQTGLDPNRRLS